MMKSWPLLGVFLFIFASAVFADTLYQNVPFYQGMNGYHTYRIPALIQASDGTMLAFAEGRKDGSGDEDNIDLVLRRSFDAGKTWQDTQIIWDDGENTCGNPTVLIDKSNGRLWLFMTHNLGDDRLMMFVNGTSKGRRTIWSCYSDDNGASWSEPYNHKDIQAPAAAMKNYWDATGPGNGIQLQKGPNAGRLIIPANARNIQSDDYGKTWYESTIFYKNGGNEGTVVEISGGAILRNDRASDLPAGFKESRIFCYSYDQGISWTPLIAYGGLPTPNCQASTIAYQAPDGRNVLLFSNPAAPTRNRMSVAISYNDALTWPVSKLIYRYNSAYSSLADMGGGKIGLLYENGDGSPYNKITFASFAFDWLCDNTVFEWNFTESGKTVKDKRGYGLDGFSKEPIEPTEDKRAAYFDGNKSGVRLGRKEAGGILDFTSDDDFYIEVVFETSSHGGGQGNGALVANDVAPGKPSWWLRVQGGFANFYIQDNRKMTSSVKSSATVNDGKRHTLLAVHEGSGRRLAIYIDGKLSASAANNTMGDFINDSDIVVGNFNNGSSPFNGWISMAAIRAGLPRFEPQKADKSQEMVRMRVE